MAKAPTLVLAMVEQLLWSLWSESILNTCRHMVSLKPFWKGIDFSSGLLFSSSSEKRSVNYPGWISGLGTVFHKISFISVRLKIASYETWLNAGKLTDLSELREPSRSRGPGSNPIWTFRLRAPVTVEFESLRSLSWNTPLNIKLELWSLSESWVSILNFC